MKKSKKEEKEWKYKAEFTSSATFQKNKFPGKQFSGASIDGLESLRSIGPSSDEIKSNPELLYTVFNVAVSNLVNLNGDAISNETALAIAKMFKNRPMNIEHMSSEIVGVITNYGFSSFPDNIILDESSLDKDSDPFNICLAAIVWKYNNPYFAEHLKYTNEEDSWSYEGVSTSWEIMFDDYVIAKGSKNLSKAEIVTDKDEIEKLNKYLTCYGGSGFDETNTEVYRVIVGDARPLGAGFVKNPAASVKGVLVIEEEEDSEDDEMEVEDSKKDMSKCDFESTIAKLNELDAKLDSTTNILLEKINTKISESSNNISQKEKITVKNIKSMNKITNVEEMYTFLTEASSKGDSISPEQIRDLVVSQLKAADVKYTGELQEKSQQLADLQSALDSAKASILELEKLKVELDETKASIKEQEEKNIYNERISKLDDKFDLNDKTRQLIAKQILGKSDEEYTQWLESDGEVILAGKEKKEKKEPTSFEQSLNTSVASTDANIPNASVPQTPSTQAPTRPTAAKKGSAIEISL